jgi:hypothetical protein
VLAHIPHLLFIPRTCRLEIVLHSRSHIHTYSNPRTTSRAIRVLAVLASSIARCLSCIRARAISTRSSHSNTNPPIPTHRQTHTHFRFEVDRVTLGAIESLTELRESPGIILAQRGDLIAILLVLPVDLFPARLPSFSIHPAIPPDRRGNR